MRLQRGLHPRQRGNDGNGRRGAKLDGAAVAMRHFGCTVMRAAHDHGVLGHPAHLDMAQDRPGQGAQLKQEQQCREHLHGSNRITESLALQPRVK